MAPSAKDKQTVGEMNKKDLVLLISECLKPVQESVKELKDEVKELRLEVDNLSYDLRQKDIVIAELRARLDESEQYSRRNNLRIFGVKEKSKENTDLLVMDVAKKIGVDISETQIDRSHRIGKPGTKPRPIIVKFVGYAPRRAMFTAKKALKGTGITIREDLTQERLSLLRQTSEAYYEKNVWTNDGVVMVKVGDKRPFRLKSYSDLEKLMVKEPPPQ
ncbi:hypothetical protein FOCC_FOCC002272 [Frankliniella occidentalis]|nr:hypothetical protein FOCC_FOCC002272 [Frankliniella occidentalis]